MRITRVPDSALARRKRLGPYSSGRRRALARAAFSLSGLLPLGAFLLIHVAANAQALAGDPAFARTAERLERIPALLLVEIVFVYAPLLVHAAIGSWLIVTRGTLGGEPSPYGSAARFAMRLTGAVALAFLAMHLPELRFRTPGARPAAGALSTLLASDLASMRYGLPLRAVAYLLGSAAVCFHFAGGLWGFFARTPRGMGPKARRRAVWWASAVGGVMWLLFADVVVFHATGVRLFGRPPAEGAPSEPCSPTPVDRG
jgi:succinate dehydrogenase / fumarate reductase cytochrome b subunit